MNHKWGKKTKDEFGFTEQTCKTCGCIRTKFYRDYAYNRSGIFFRDQRPDCIDWEIENKKTID